MISLMNLKVDTKIEGLVWTSFMWIVSHSCSCFRSCGVSTIVYWKWCFIFHM